jgi:hypothetical protein
VAEWDAPRVSVGNPALVRTTVECARLGGAIGISPADQHVFPARITSETRFARRMVSWVYQRDWLYYTLWGRLSYDPETPERVWIEKFRQRYGAAEGEEFYQASPKPARSCRAPLRLPGFIPIIAARQSNSKSAATCGGRAGDAPFDLMNVQAPIEFARRCVEKRPSARMSPMRCRKSLMNLRQIRAIVSKKQGAAREKLRRTRQGGRGGQGAGEGKAAEDNRGTGDPREFDALCGDMEMLQNLARFHAARLRTPLFFALCGRPRPRRGKKPRAPATPSAVDSWRRLRFSANSITNLSSTRFACTPSNSRVG